MSPRFMNVVFTRIGFAIQKGLAAQPVAHLPSILSVNNDFFNYIDLKAPIFLSI